MHATHDLRKASVLALVSFFFLSLYILFIKRATVDPSVIWINFIVYLSALVFMIPLLINKGMGFFKTQHFGTHLLRSLAGLASNVFFLLAVMKIPIVNATLLLNTPPIFIPILSVLMYGAKIPRSVWLAVAIGFLGIIIIIKPTSHIIHEIGGLLGLASGLSLAFAHLMVKHLSGKDLRLLVVFNFFFLSAVIQAPLLFFAGAIPLGSHAFQAMCAGFFLLLFQLFLVESYKYAEASQVGVYQYSTVVFVALISWLAGGAIPSGYDLLGGLLVVIAGIIIIRSGSGKKI